MTIFARNPDTGKAAWAYQKTPHDAWDYDGINENVLADVSVNGTMRKVLVNFDRNGFSYMLDRKTGELLQANKFAEVNWASSIDLKTGRPVENPDKRTSSTRNVKDICPSAMGAKNQQPVSFSPQTGLLLRAEQQPVHGLRGRRGEVPGRSAVRRRDRGQQGGPWSATAASSSRGIRPRARKSGASRRNCRPGAGRCRPPVTSSSTGRWKAG